MPTKRRAGPAPIGNLSSGLVNVLLTGDDPEDPFLVHEEAPKERGGYLRRLFRENRPALLAEFRRRGLTGKPWVLRS